MLKHIFAAAVVLMLGGVTRAAADDLDDCNSANPDLGIRGCTNLIAGGHLQGDNLAFAYYNLGNNYHTKGDLDRAIAAYSQAIRVKPNYAAAYYNRGLSYDNKGDLDRAIADYTEAVRLRPDLAVAFNNRSIAYRSKGDIAGANADCARARQIGPGSKCSITGQGSVTGQSYETTCIEVSSRAGWQPFTFRKGNFLGYTTSGGWSVDSRNYASVDDRGHIADAARLEPYSQYKYVKDEPFGALLFRDSSNRVVPGRTIREADVLREWLYPVRGETIHLRINDSDAALGDNAGSLRVCFKEKTTAN